MNSKRKYFCRYELDETSFPEFRDRIVKIEAEGVPHQARRYSGYPQTPLEKVKPKFWSSLEKSLNSRRTYRNIDTTMISKTQLSTLLQFSHGVTGPQFRGPTPSSGELQSLELYLAIMESSWIEAGIYHYDRDGHYLAQISPQADREQWRKFVPSMRQFDGGAFFWILVGDGARIERKYGDRGYRFLLLEAGHLMQNLCLLSVHTGLTTLPLGGFFEGDIARTLHLSSTDVVLYLGVCGKVK